MLFFFFTLGSIEDDEEDCFQRDQRACKRNATDAHQHRRMQSLDCTRFSASQAQFVFYNTLQHGRRRNPSPSTYFRVLFTLTLLSPCVSCSRTQSALTFLCFQRHLAVRYWTFFQILSAKNVFYLVTIEYYVFNIQEKLELKTDNHKYTHIQKRQLKKIQKMDTRCYSFTRW